MGFLSPWFLVGAIAVGLPLWLHLLRQHRRTPLSFSSVMFFERREQTSVQHRRLRYLLLLAIRIALLLLIVLAFAAPFINRKAAAATAKKLTVIAVDRSFSMRYGDRMQQAKLEAQRQLNSLPANNLAEIMAVDSNVELLTQPMLDRSTLRSAIDAIAPGDLASSFGQFVRALRVQEQSTGMFLDVRFISDMQRTGMPRSFTDLQVGPHTSLQLVSLAQANSPNWAVESVTSSSHVYHPKSARATATISGWQTKAETKNLLLFLDGKLASSQTVNVPANGRAQVQFLGFDVPYGVHRMDVRMEPGDGLPEDDLFPFSIERSDSRKILFFSNGSRVRGDLYYRVAIESAGATGLLVQPTFMEQPFENALSQCAFAVLNDVGELDQSREQAFSNYVRKGGALLIAVGARSRESGRVPVVGTRFSIVRKTQGANFVDSSAAAIRGLGQLRNVQFFETAKLDLPPESRVLMKLADGSPLLVEERLGEGRVLTFASGLDNVANDFPLHTSFLPFVTQTSRYLAGNEETEKTLVAGTQISLRGTDDGGAAANVKGPDGKSELSLSEATKAASFPLDRDGFYEVQRAHGPGEIVAVHSDRRESDLTPIPEQTLALWRNTGKQPSPSPTRAVDMSVQPWSLWRYAIILALAAALAESLLANSYLSKRRQTG